MLAAAFAHRWDYRLRGRHLLIGTIVAALLALATEVGARGEGQRAVGVVLGVVQMAGGG